MSAATEAPTFGELFESHARFVGRALRYLGVDEAHLADACQEVFVVVHRRLKTYRERGSPRAWIRQICVFVANNHRRSVRRSREEAGASTPVEGVSPPTQQQDLELRQQRSRLLAVLDELPPEQREVFVLYEIEQLTMSEITEALSCPAQTAYSRLHAARAKVRARIAWVMQ
jgi:RNA polymerase sigma-70 factor (ECF subfamily)